jgi:hypothetical protein
VAVVVVVVVAANSTTARRATIPIAAWTAVGPGAAGAVGGSNEATAAEGLIEAAAGAVEGSIEATAVGGSIEAAGGAAEGSIEATAAEGSIEAAAEVALVATLPSLYPNSNNKSSNHPTHTCTQWPRR